MGGVEENLKMLMDAKPDILNHNIETVRRLSDRVRARAKYDRSLEFYAERKKCSLIFQLNRALWWA